MITCINCQIFQGCIKNLIEYDKNRVLTGHDKTPYELETMKATWKLMDEMTGQCLGYGG